MPSIQAVHTIGVMACVLTMAYTLWRLEQAARWLGADLRQALQEQAKEQAEIRALIKRIWERIEQIEGRI